MAESNSRERDLVLAPNEFAFIGDKTKGNVVCYVGPHKVSLSATDSPVIFNYRTKRYDDCVLDSAIQIFPTAPEGWYIVLKNPAKSRDLEHPRVRSANDLTDLVVGKKINIPGPVSFPLWPGQMVKVIQGHRLRSNQYLVIRVYDDVEVQNNQELMRSLLKYPNNVVIDPSAIVIGQQFLIKGTDTAFYIPPTGIEVVPELPSGRYVREAATLERLEYCILLNENGNKRYVKGPDVVFPEPTEAFMEMEESRKFKAIELSPISAIHVKVIADYEDEAEDTPEPEDSDDKTGDTIARVMRKLLEPGKHRVGDELFITGEDQMIYYPRPEHAIIKYDGRTIHYAVAVPEGDARYVLNRLSGEIKMVKGPCMLLPDPRDEVIVLRVLTPNQSKLWFPGNIEAVEHNEKMGVKAARSAGYVTMNSLSSAAMLDTFAGYSPTSAAMIADGFDRQNKFTPPRTITIDNKYDGAVRIDIWTGYAIQVVSKTGNRKVIVGPTSYLLEYDEYLEAMELSTGKPKSTDKVLKTVYLRTMNNKISDIILAETSDYCPIQIKVSYCVNFEDNSDSWFGAENYVKLLSDHMRSVIRNDVRRYGIEDFYADPTGVIRKSVLGDDLEGHIFYENNMRVYDVEVLDVSILDPATRNVLIEFKRGIVNDSIRLEMMKRKRDLVKEEELIKSEIEASKASSATLLMDIKRNQVAEQLAYEMAETDKKVLLSSAVDKAMLESTELSKQISRNESDSKMIQDIPRIELERALVEIKIGMINAEADALVKRAEAISPDLVAALQSVGDNSSLERVAQAMSPMAIIGGQSIGDTVSKMMEGTVLSRVASKFMKNSRD